MSALAALSIFTLKWEESKYFSTVYCGKTVTHTYNWILHSFGRNLTCDTVTAWFTLKCSMLSEMH